MDLYSKCIISKVSKVNSGLSIIIISISIIIIVGFPSAK